MAVRGELSWPSLGRCYDRPWGILVAACGEIAMAVDTWPPLSRSRWPSGGWAATNGEVESVELVYGWGFAQEPQVRVTTTLAGGHVVAPEPTQLVEPDPYGPGPGSAAERHRERAASVSVDGRLHHARLVEAGGRWAARAEVDGPGPPLVVSVVGEGAPPSDLSLTKVADLEPFLVGRRQHRDTALQRARDSPSSGPEDWDLPPAKGLKAHRALVEAMVAHSLAIKEAIAERRRPPSPAQDYGRSWEAATRAQMALAAQGRDDAEAAVRSMVNHLTHLAKETAWFPADVTLAEAAISETIERVAYGRDVPSRIAQDAWERWWELRQAGPPGRDRPGFGPRARLSDAEAAERQAWSRQMQDHQSAWHDAWERWRADR